MKNLRRLDNYDLRLNVHFYIWSRSQIDLQGKINDFNQGQKSLQRQTNKPVHDAISSGNVESHHPPNTTL